MRVRAVRATEARRTSSWGAWIHAPIQRKCACGAAVRSGDACPECVEKQEESSKVTPMRSQLRFSIGAANDPLEREADTVAAAVTSGRASQPIAAAPSGLLRRSADAVSAGPATTTEAQPLLHEALRSSGQPLDSGVRVDLESRLGHDFSRVRVHSDERAARSARAVNALAYTVGDDIVFDRGMYAPQTPSGRTLLAHELTHVVQQGDSTAGNAVVRRQKRHNLPLEESPEFPSCSPYERFRLDHQLTRARTLTDTARSQVGTELARTDRSSGTISLAGSAIQRLFKTDQTGHIRTVLTRLNQIQNRLNRGPSNWQCVTEAGCRALCGSSGADACAAPQRISVCPAHFRPDDLYGALALVHEAAHQVGLGLSSTVDPFQGEIYESDPRFAALTTGQALDTPDAFAALVGQLAFGHNVRDVLGRGQWSPWDLTFKGVILEPKVADVGQPKPFANRPPEVERFKPGTAIRNRFQGSFIFNSSFNKDSPPRPSLLRPPRISLRMTLTRAQAAKGRPKTSTLFDRADEATPNINGRLAPPGGEYAFDLNFDPADAGIVSITAELRDPDTSTVLTYRDSLPVRP